MEVVYEGLETFKRSLPAALVGYWAELLIGLLTFQLLAFVGKMALLCRNKPVIGSLLSVYCSVIGFYCLRSNTKGRTVCLIGLSDSGKTLLFLQVSDAH